MTDVTPPKDAVVVEVNGRYVDPKKVYAQDAENTDHIIITLYHILEKPERAALVKLEVEILEDLGENNMLCRYKPTDLEPLRDLKFVRQVDVYRNKLKIPSALQMLCDIPELRDETFLVDVMVHQDSTNTASLADSLATKLDLNREDFLVLSDKIRLEVPLRQLNAITADDRVRVLEEVVTPVVCDDKDHLVISSPVKSLGHSIFKGHGQVVAVYDTGFDLGSADNCHPAFAGKVVKLVPLGRAPDLKLSAAEKVDDPKGHGTHVCGTIVGENIDTSQGVVGGVAPSAKLVMSALADKQGDLINVPQIKEVFSGVYKNYGAYIHSNSWGDNGVITPTGFVRRSYGNAASNIDTFVRQNPDAVICFSAGNQNGDAKGQPAVGSQACAKNCITVGACGSPRAIRTESGDLVEEINPEEIWFNSSRGPTIDKRVKPDVVAPGFNIFSAQTRHAKSMIKEADLKRPKASSPQYPGTLWTARTGTSHATPIIAGYAAVIREVLQSKGLEKPPAALIKAVIINGADKLPNIDMSAQGFGRANLDRSITMLDSAPIFSQQLPSTPVLSTLAGTFIGDGLVQGSQFTFTLTPPASVLQELKDNSNSPSDLKITMVYNDLPMARIQNNLNLAVIDPMDQESIRHGGVSETDMNLQNNVEQVVWNFYDGRPLLVRVTAQKILVEKDTQDYALAWCLCPSEMRKEVV